MTGALDSPGVSLSADRLIGLRFVTTRHDDSIPLAALPGGYAAKRRGHGQEMVDVREYVAGDDIRHLDRGSTARTGDLHVRTFQEERDRIVILVADFRPSMLWGLRRAFRSVAAAEALSMIGWRTVEEGGRVGLLAFGAGDPVIVPVRGRVRGMLAVIGGMVRAHDAALNLALAGVNEDPPLFAGLVRLRRIAPKGCEVVLASGFDNTGAAFAEQVMELDQKRIVRLFKIGDGLSDSLPPGTYPIRLPDGASIRARVGGRTEAMAGQQTALAEIGGIPVLALDAGAGPEAMAGTVAAAFQSGRVYRAGGR